MYAAFKYSGSRQQNVLRTGHALSDDQIRAYVPSVFAEQPHDSRSDRYAYVPTGAVLADLRAEGFVPFEARQAATRIAGKRGYTQHMLRLRHASVQAYAEGAPEIILVNSHDGSSSVSLMSGYFRMVCSNGLIAGNSLTAPIKVHHKGNAGGLIIDGCTRIVEDTAQITSTIDRWSGITVNRDTAVAYAEKALALRWEPGQAPVKALDLLRVRRGQDRGNSAWHLLNIVQENVLRGGLRGHNANGGRYTTRAVSGVAENVSLNRQLWDLVDEVVHA